MPESESVLVEGDEVCIVHQHTAQKHRVTFAGLGGQKKLHAYVRWSIAGVYKVDVKSGHLSERKVQAWKLSDEDHARLIRTVRKHQEDTVLKQKRERYGTR